MKVLNKKTLLRRIKRLFVRKTCMLLGTTEGKGADYARKYAAEDCTIVFMDIDKEKGYQLKEELERDYDTKVFFFHGDLYAEDEVDIFLKAVKQQFKRVHYCFCNCWNWPYQGMLNNILIKEATVQCIHPMRIDN